MVPHDRKHSLFFRGSLLILLVGFISFPVLPLQPAPVTKAPPDTADLNQVLALMNKFGQSFRSFSAKISQKKYVAVLKEYDPEEKGVFYYERTPDKQARLRKEITEPTPSIATIDKGIVTVYEPKLKQARRINLGKDKDKAEFLAIGIGQEPKKLEETFHLKVLGSETLQGQKTYLLEMKPKASKAAALFSAIVLWVDAVRGVPIQQKFIEPNGDFMLVSFSDIKINPKIPAGTFQIKLPKDVQILQ